MKPLDVILALLVPVIWGMGFVVAKAAMEHFPPILLMALRFSVTALVLVWWFRPPKGILMDLFWVAMVSAALQYSLTFTGLKEIDASTAALLVQLEVPFGVLMGYLFFHDRITTWQVFGMMLAFAGTTLIVGEPSLANSMFHMMLVIAGAFTWSVGQVMLKRLGAVGGFTLITWIAVLATPQLFIASFVVETGQWEAIRTAYWGVWMAVVYLGIIMTAVGYAMWYHLLGKYSVGHVMPFLLLLPVAAVAGGVLFLDEVLTPKILIGGVLSLAGVAIITIIGQRRRRLI
ncbi:MAG: EamA family transporter [Arenicellales bacterium]